MHVVDLGSCLGNPIATAFNTPITGSAVAPRNLLAVTLFAVWGKGLEVAKSTPAYRKFGNGLNVIRNQHIGERVILLC